MNSIVILLLAKLFLIPTTEYNMCFVVFKTKSTQGPPAEGDKIPALKKHPSHLQEEDK